MHIPFESAKSQLLNSGHLFLELFSHGTLRIELYKPMEIDLQQPHTRDEVYIIASGSGRFILAGKIVDFNVNDLLFVPAGADHRFLDFTDDFSTWVIFYGPEGGE